MTPEEQFEQYWQKQKDLYRFQVAEAFAVAGRNKWRVGEFGKVLDLINDFFYPAGR